MIRLSRVITVTAAVALLAGLALPPDAHAQKTFKMGAIVPVSGPAAAFGLGVQRGMEFAAEDIGTLTVGGDKYKIEVVTYDTVYDPGKTVAAMNRAVYNDGASLREHTTGLAVLAAWAALSFLFAVKRFKWV